MSSVYVKDSLRNAVEAASGGKVTVLYDDVGNPSYMRRFSPVIIKDLFRQYFDEDADWNASAFKAVENQVHPAFLKDGTVIRELLIGQYLASELNGRGCSLPGVFPRVYTNYDNSLLRCTNKGPGWTMMTAYMRGFLQALCLRQKYQPRGNTQYGRSHEAPWETVQRKDNLLPGVTSGEASHRTGTGPSSWNHDGTETGIADLVGNVWEWGHLMKLVDGKIMMPEDNNFDLAEASWPDTGFCFDSTVGTSDGSGIDLTTGDLGNPVLSDEVTKHTGPIGNDGYYKAADIYGAAGFRSTAKKSDLALSLSLIFAGLAPIIHYDGAYETGYELNGGIWTRNYGTRLPLFGGLWYDGASAGLGALFLNSRRGSAAGRIGFRPAFVLI